MHILWYVAVLGAAGVYGAICLSVLSTGACFGKCVCWWFDDTVWGGLIIYNNQ